MYMNYLQKVIDKIKQELPEAEIFLFGSYVNGNFRKNSDYDIWILGKYKLPLRDYLSLKRELNDKINYKVDLVDFNRVSEDFKKIALKNIELWSK